jgi:hypothetical protein
MKLVVYGIKNGSRTLYSTDKALPSVAENMRNGTDNEHALGKSLYSLSFADNGCVFTRYLIARDSLRNQATGYIAFSLFLPANKEANVKSILDELADFYTGKYIENNNLKKVNEDWTFADNILKKYTEQDKLWYDKGMKSGDVENIAFIYYSSETELLKYFDKPCQEKYEQYRQILFVDSNLKGQLCNPLNILKHTPEADLTGKINFENPYYRLLSNGYGNNGVRIEIQKNGEKCSYKERIFKTDSVSIQYSKKYYERILVEGKVTDLEYLTFNETTGEVDVKKDIVLKALTKTIAFQIEDRNGIPINNAEIQIRAEDHSQPPQPWLKVNGYRYQHTFEGDELGKTWIVSVKQGDFFDSQQFSIPGDTMLVCKYKRLKITVKFEYIKEPKPKNKKEPKPEDKKEPEPEALISIFLKSGETSQYRRSQPAKVGSNEFEFTGEEIDKTWDITVSDKGKRYEPVAFEYNPATDRREIRIELKRKQDSKEKSKTNKTYFWNFKTDKRQ